MKIKHLLPILLAVASCCGPKPGVHTLHILSTNDVHGCWFDSTYTDGRVKNSLFAIYSTISDFKQRYGEDNVLLLDAGDCLQGDNAPYYYNYIDTVAPHLFPRIMHYMGYDAIAVGNHDIEAGHGVYDRVTADLESYGIPFLAANAIRNDNGKTWFPPYKVFKKAGLKVLVLGYTNANNAGWVPAERYSGMHFESLVPQVQQDVDRIKAKVKPDVTIALMHSGAGKGDGSQPENQALDLRNTLRGVDFIVYAHDHRPRVENADTMVIMNSGSHARFLAHGTLTANVGKDRKVVKTLDVELIPTVKENADKGMKEAFAGEFGTVKAFTLSPVGSMDFDLRTRDAYKGMSAYTNLLHTLALGCTPATISIAAPLTYDGTVKAGELAFNDLFTIYPFENQLFILKMTGREIKDYLEYSYEQWIQTFVPGGHILKIQQADDLRLDRKGWSFKGRAYNFDSAAGINYTVDVTKPFGQRISISGMAGGHPFEADREYNVAMTSYRAAGGGDLLSKGAGIQNPGERTVKRYPEIRNILYQYLAQTGALEEAVISDPARIGHWEFVPKDLANRVIAQDMELLFPTF
ncbi:MAG: bifunctional metallophosphatase/5'-nucleotidase [Bacteroidales bacterium]|nr:bifunctional metallophosphatase/5'-nucleotidase [Bacteroidales bacterium]